MKENVQTRKQMNDISCIVHALKIENEYSCKNEWNDEEELQLHVKGSSAAHLNMQESFFFSTGDQWWLMYPYHVRIGFHIIYV